MTAQALRYQDVDTLAVLDNRAGTYSKLGQYDQALRDARQMIKKDKSDERVRPDQDEPESTILF